MIRHLNHCDLHELQIENRVMALEIALERLFDYDLIDDHIMACQKRLTEAYQKRLQFVKDKNLKKKDKKDVNNSTINLNNSNNAISNSKVQESKEDDESAYDGKFIIVI